MTCERRLCTVYSSQGHKHLCNLILLFCKILESKSFNNLIREAVKNCVWKVLPLICEKTTML